MNKNFFKTNYQSILAMVAIVLLGVVFYGLTLRGVPGNPTAAEIQSNLTKPTKPFELSPERGRYVHIMALADTGKFDLSPALRDIAYPDVGYTNDGRYFSFFAPGIPYLVLPFYAAGEKFDLAQVFSFGAVALLAIFNMLFIFKIAKNILNLPLWAALFAAVTFGFGSTAWSYAITLYQHQFTTFFIISSLYAVWKFRQHQKLSWLWAALVWLNYGLAIFVDYPNAVLLLPIMVYLLISTVKFSFNSDTTKISIRISALITMLAFIVVTGLHFYHNSYYFGSWKQLSGTLASYKQAPAVTGSTSAVAEKSVVGFFSEQKIVRGFDTLVLSLDRGLFLYDPLFILAVVGAYLLIRKKITLEVGVLFSVVAVNLFLYSSWGDPWGGWAYGPRYLIPSMAVLSLLVGVAVGQTKYKLSARTLAFGLSMYTSAIALLGALTTNAVPPQVEAVALENKFNFILNLDFFNRGQSGSFLFNNFFDQFVSLSGYYWCLYGLLMVIVAIILFVLPHIHHES